MAATVQSAFLFLKRRARSLQLLTVVWMMIEAALSLASAWNAHSPALFGFGGDSAIELFSAVVVLWRFHPNADSRAAEKTASRIAGVLLFVVAAFVLFVSVFALLGYQEPRPSFFGIAVLFVAAFGMPILASQKRKVAAQLSSPSLRADAAQSSLCGYLSWIALVGLVVNAFFHWSWADPVAGLALLPFVVKEGWESIRSARVHCNCQCSRPA